MRFLIPLLLAAGAMASHGASRYYTFTGRILEIDDTLAGYADSLGIQVGDAAAYVFAVDTARPGYFMTNGSYMALPDSQNLGSGFRRYFFDSLAAPSLFSAAVEDKGSGSFFGFRTLITNGTATARGKEATEA